MSWMRLELQVKVFHLAGAIGEQDGSGCHWTTADKRTKRRKWSQEENSIVMQCYYRSENGRNGYRKRMRVIWNEIRMFNVTKQRLVDQKNNISKRKWLLNLELEEIPRNIKDIGHGEVKLESNEGMVLGIWSWRTECVYERIWRLNFALEDCMVPNIGEKLRICKRKDANANYERGHDHTWENV